MIYSANFQGKEYALKTITMQKDSRLMKLDKEIDINLKIEYHKNICRFHKIYKFD